MADTDINAVLDKIEGAGGADDTAAATDVVDDDLGTRDTFDRAYVEKLRRENAGYRTDAKTARDELGRFTGAFEGVDDGLRDTILGLPKALANDPKGTAAWLKDQAEQILAADVVDDPREGTTDEERPLTRKEVDKILAERDQAAAVEAQVGVLRREVEGLGIKWDSEQATAIMAIASSHTGGDITKAHELIKGWGAAAVEGFVDGKKADAEKTVQPTGVGNSVTDPEKKISNTNDAKHALNEHLKALGYK